MAKKISQLSAASVLNTTDEFEINQGGTSKKVSAATMGALFGFGTYTGSDGITLTGSNFTLNNAYFTGQATVALGVVTLSNAAVIAKVLTGYSAGAGTITASDSILSAIQKLSGNLGLYLPLAGGTMSGNIIFTNNLGIDVAATAGSDVLNIGTSNADVINIGYSGSSINMQGTLFYQNVTNVTVKDKLITLNKGGSAASSVSTGFEMEENSVITGYFATNGTRDGYDFKAPAITGVATLSLASLSSTSRTYTLQDASSTLAMYSNNLSVFASTTSAQLASVMSDETGTGVLVFGTAPTFITNITTPLIYGGAAAGSQLNLQGTSGNGTSTVSAINILVGNNGATTAGKWYNNGNFNIGNATDTSQRLVRVGQDTAIIDIGSLVGAGSYAAIYLNQATPSITNWTLVNDGAGVTSVGGTSKVQLGISGNVYFSITTTVAQLASGVVFNGTAVATGAPIPYSFVTPTNTGQTASTNIPNFKVTGSTKTWAAGALTNQYFNYFTANTIAFVSASALTTGYNLYVEGVTTGTNATVTKSYAAGFQGSIEVAGRVFVTDGNGNGILGYDIEVSKTVNGGVEHWVRNTSNGTGAFAQIAIRGDSTPQLKMAVLSSGFTPAGFFLQNSTFLLTGGTSIANLIIGHQSASKNIYFVSGSTTTSIHSMYNGGATSGALSSFDWTPISNTGQTASTEISGYLYNSYSRQWATGNITTQRERYYKTVTYTAVGASTFTNAYGAYFEAPTASTNVTITNNYALGLSGGALILAQGIATYAPLKFISTGTGTTGLLMTEEAGTLNYTTYGLWHGYAASTRHKVWHGKSAQTAPATSIGVGIVNYYGSAATNFLGDPNGWATIILEDGSTAKVPYYT